MPDRVPPAGGSDRRANQPAPKSTAPPPTTPNIAGAAADFDALMNSGNAAPESPRRETSADRYGNDNQPAPSDRNEADGGQQKKAEGREQRDGQSQGDGDGEERQLSAGDAILAAFGGKPMEGVAAAT